VICVGVTCPVAVHSPLGLYRVRRAVLAFTAFTPLRKRSTTACQTNTGGGYALFLILPLGIAASLREQMPDNPPVILTYDQPSADSFDMITSSACI
jgi:hypothetical protein